MMIVFNIGWEFDMRKLGLLALLLILPMLFYATRNRLLPM